MTPSRMKKTAVAAVAALSVAVGGTALAAGGTGTSTSFLDRVATKLGISSQKLQDATKAAATDQVDEQLKAGTITQAQADAMKAQIQAGNGVGLGGPGPGGRGMGGPGKGGPGGHLADAATYLGLTQAKLMEQLQAGKTLADVAKAQGKTTDGLKAALVASEKKELDALVKAGTITQAQADQMLTDSGTRFDDMIAGKMPQGGPGGPGGRGGHGFPGAPGSPSGSSGSSSSGTTNGASLS